MAEFKKYNGYYVKDASALAHASISGKTLTTLDRDGRTVDTLTLPGGNTPSATSMAYHNASIDQAYALSVNSIFNGNPDMSEPFTFGQVMSDEMIGYGEITYNTGLYTLGSIYAHTIRSWNTYDRTDGIPGPGHDNNTNIGDTDSFETGESYLHRKSNYKAYLCVGKSNVYTTVTAGSAKRIMATSGNGGNMSEIPVKAADGAIYGYATIVGVKPLIKGSRSGSSYTVDRAGLIMYYDKTAGVVAYNATSADIRVDAFILELDVIIESQYCDVRSMINNPYIKYLNIEAPIGTMSSDTIQIRTNVIVHSRVESTSDKLVEYKLTHNTSGVWSWSRDTAPIPDVDVSSYYNTKISRLHTIYDAQTFNYNDFCSAVVYGIGDYLTVRDHEFTDALPIPYPMFFPLS